MTLAKTQAAFLIGLHPTLVTVEVALQIGIPGLQIVGLANRSVAEAKQRVIGALHQLGIRLPARKCVVNLAPGHVLKTGTSFDLAIAAGLLAANGKLRFEISQVFLVGELALDGQVRSVPGLLGMILKAQTAGLKIFLIPAAQLSEVVCLTSLVIIPLCSLAELLSLTPVDLEHSRVNCSSAQSPKNSSLIANRGQTDLDEIVGQDQAKRALTITAAGLHHLLLVGPPGCGKTLLAQAIVGLLPTMSVSEQIEVTQIYSAAGLNPDGLLTDRPFRAPHHSISLVGLVGGGMELRPGEITLAHRGVLFLDELPEFQAVGLEALRQPLETGSVTLVRSKGSLNYPATCLLIAAANPCRCGWYQSQVKNCRCSPQSLVQYHQRLSGPLLDRFDLIVKLDAVPITQLMKSRTSSISTVTTTLAGKITQVRNVFGRPAGQMSLVEVQGLKLEPSVKQLLTRAATHWQLSARVCHKLIRVALTIARLESETEIKLHHLAEALQYRVQL
ncbi:MAG TPA: hypothetical protein DEP87_02735 [Candidatus Pacebacteria bacterium]|nr:hypothetical protein [Candidatus Paceibacterota bacterium]